MRPFSHLESDHTLSVSLLAGRLESSRNTEYDDIYG
jgi:hypothetical protein